MAGGPLLDRTARHVRQLVGLLHPVEILTESARFLRAETGARLAFAWYVVPGRPWTSAAHGMAADEPRAPTPAAISAAFAVNSRLTRAQGPVSIARGDDTEPIFRGLAPGAPARCLHAVPIRQRLGRAIGGTLLVFDDPPDAATIEFCAPAADILASALDNSERMRHARLFRERLLMLAETTQEALWDWDLVEQTHWLGGAPPMADPGRSPPPQNEDWKCHRVHPEDADRVRQSLARAIGSAASSWKEEYRYRLIDGAWAIVEDRGYFLREPDGRAYRMLGTMRDVTAARKEVQAREALVDELSRTLRYSEMFMGILGHDLRNPLSAITSSAAYLARLAQADRITQSVSRILRSAGRMERMINQLLDFTRIRLGRGFLLDRAPLDIGEFCRLLLDEVQTAHNSPIILECRGDCLGSWDRDRLAQLVTNLAGNACQHGKSGVPVLVQVDGTGEDVVHLRFRNVGAIPGRLLPDIFDPLKQRSSPEHSSGMKGLGLGLFISRQIAAAHGGTILAESDERQDVTMFTVELPRRAAAIVHDARGTPEVGRVEYVPAPRSSRSGPARVLVVDDDADVCQSLAEALEEEGYDVATAMDGLDALARMRERAATPDVIVLDLTMPRMNGAQFRQELLAAPEWSRIPVILLSADGALRAVAETLGVTAFLEKPVNLAELLRLLALLVPDSRRVMAR